MKAVICPKCGQNASDPKLIEDLFGYRKVPHPKPQSWCRACRNKQKRRTYEPTSTAFFNPIPAGDIMECIDWDKVDRKALQVAYISAYPNDKNNLRRSYNFMAARLKRKLAK